jgi:hypothetical protein
MLITVKEGTGVPVWTSPDQRVSIYDIVDGDGNKWSTKSHKIGKGQGQSFEVEIEQKNGKTYLRLPYDPNASYPPRSQQPAAATANAEQFQQAAVSGQTIARFELLVNRLSTLVERLEKYDGAVTDPEPLSPEAVADFFNSDDEPPLESRQPE